MRPSLIHIKDKKDYTICTTYRVQDRRFYFTINTDYPRPAGYSTRVNPIFILCKK